MFVGTLALGLARRETRLTHRPVGKKIIPIAGIDPRVEFSGEKRAAVPLEPLAFGECSNVGHC